jgi:cellulose synthase/poly-beta-1,6-N-acetylglucosamine synthase-like glycosyltransferase
MSTALSRVLPRWRPFIRVKKVKDQGSRKTRKLNLDQLVGNTVPILLVGYVISFGIYQLHGVHFDFSVGYLTILLPLWLIDGMRGSYEVFLRRYYHASPEELDKVTVVVACKDGEAVIGETLNELLRRFRRKQIIVSSNGSTDRTCEIVKELGAVCLEVKEPIGKVRAINYALDYVKTPYVLLLDDDTLIGDAIIPTGLLERGYAAVAFRVFVRKSTWVTQFQDYEYRKSSDIGKLRHNKRATVQNVSGAIGLFGLEELKRQVKLHTGEFSGEDLQRTLLVHLADKRKGVVLANSIVYTAPPDTLKQLYKQRVFGWFPGLYANFFNYLKVAFKKDTPLALREDSLYNCILVMLFDITRLLALPVAIFYPWYFVIMYVAYVVLETVTYVNRRHLNVPYWVVLFYPFYGMFGLLTRLGAFGTFLYRRIAVKLSRFDFLDDYRRAPGSIKIVSSIVVIVLIAAVFVLNLLYRYSSIFTNAHP